MKINEIKYSIQGEGVYQGLPTVLVRLQGCNMFPPCIWCDTSHAQNPNEGEEMAAEDILGEVTDLLPVGGGWVCITGGEPLWQEDGLEELVRLLRKCGYQIEVETNGSFLKPRWWTLIDSWCADIKCPSSGVCGTSKETWFKTRPSDQIKFVVGNEEDLEFTKEVIKRHRTDSPTVLVSPVFPSGQEWMRGVVEFCKEHRIRFSLQWHKLLYGDVRGV